MDGLKLIEQELVKMVGPVVQQVVGDALGALHNRVTNLEANAGILPTVTPVIKAVGVNVGTKSAVPTGTAPRVKQSWEK